MKNKKKILHKLLILEGSLNEVHEKLLKLETIDARLIALDQKRATVIPKTSNTVARLI